MVSPSSVRILSIRGRCRNQPPQPAPTQGILVPERVADGRAAAGWDLELGSSRAILLRCPPSHQNVRGRMYRWA